MSDNFDIFGEGISDPEDIKNPNEGMDAAYIASAKKTFLGKEISGWSGRRRAATFEIGFSGNGSFLDPVRVVYCCICSPNDITAIFRMPTQAIEAFLNWAEKNECMDPSGKNFSEIMRLANEIIDEVEQSDFDTSDENNSPQDQEAGNAIGHQE